MDWQPLHVYGLLYGEHMPLMSLLTLIEGEAIKSISKRRLKGCDGAKIHRRHKEKERALYDI